MSLEIRRNRERIIVADNYEEMSYLGAVSIYKTIKAYAEPTILFPAGNTQEGLKPRLVRFLTPLEAKVINFCNLDENCVPDGQGSYKRIDPRDLQSFYRGLKTGLLDKLPRHKNINHYCPDETNIALPGSFDYFLYSDTKLGGVALVVDGLGEDDHIMGFNQRKESHIDSITRWVELDAELRATNQAKYGHETLAPPAAITVGVSTCLRADSGLTLVSGGRKATALYRAIYEDISPDCPSAYWREHDNHLWLVDREAAAEIL